jgi:WhiB family redox-sensing transcriptional regulator
VTAADHLAEWLEGPAWHADAVCRQIGGDEWFPNKGESPREAKKICATCPVSAECLQYALDNDERFGIWGGVTERDRRKLKKAGR